MTSPRRQTRWQVSNDVAPSIYFGLDRKRCGIYTLEFEGGERYVGQTVDLTSRIAAHRRRWDDIVAVSFVECGVEELDSLERAMIRDAERSYVVRNKAFTNMPGGPAELDFVVDAAEQSEWLEGVRSAYPLDERTRAAERRRRTHPKYEEVAAQPRFAEVLDDLTAYIDAVIPWPSATGGLYWGVTAMPSTARAPGRRRLYTVNAHNVELLYVMHFAEGDKIIGILNVHSGIVSPADRRGLSIERQPNYRSFQDCEDIQFSLGEMPDLLSRLTVVQAARSMALGLMRRGPSNFSKFHSDALLDEVLLNRPEPASS